MTEKNLLLLSSSRAKNSAYLAPALPFIATHLTGINELLFIPYAGITTSYDEYTLLVSQALSSLNIKVKGIHEYADPQAAVASAKAIAIGGGNTFNLLHQLYENNLITCLQKQVNQGIPYIGWSAGSNVAGASIRTTNDMPIIEPKSFAALNLVPFQLNPHYIEESPSDHHGETREQRLAEFMVLHPETSIVGLVEGSALKLSSNKRKQHLQLLGTEQGYLFRAGEKQIIDNQTDLSYLLA